MMQPESKAPPIEAGGRHDTESSKKVRTPNLFLRSNYG